MINETIKGFGNEFRNGNEAFESKGLKDNFFVLENRSDGQRRHYKGWLV